jgi:hypothetical protein
MFTNCSGLTVAPELPATTLINSCYEGMFENCIDLTVAPELPATKIVAYAYYNMFNGCTSLNYIRTSLSGFDTTNGTKDWVKNVASERNICRF